MSEFYKVAKIPMDNTFRYLQTLPYNQVHMLIESLRNGAEPIEEAQAAAATAPAATNSKGG